MFLFFFLWQSGISSTLVVSSEWDHFFEMIGNSVVNHDLRKRDITDEKKRRETRQKKRSREREREKQLTRVTLHMRVWNKPGNKPEPTSSFPSSRGTAYRLPSLKAKVQDAATLRLYVFINTSAFLSPLVLWTNESSRGDRREMQREEVQQ